MCEVVAVDAYVAHAQFAQRKVVANEVEELLRIALVVVDFKAMVQGTFEQGFELQKFLGGVVAGSHVPVEVVLSQHVEHGIVGQESYLFGIERSEE